MTTLRRPLAWLLLALAGTVALTATLATSVSAASADPGGERGAGTTSFAVSHGAAPTSGERARYYWGAMAISSDSAGGGAYNYRSKRAAKHRAMIGCKERSNYPQNCVYVAIWANQCAAVAITRNADGFVNNVKSGFDRFRQHAKREALRKLPGGHIWNSLCSG